MASAPPRPILFPKPDPDAPRAAMLPTLVTPKPEPDAPPTAFPFTPELCAIFRHELEPSAHDDPDFARILRLSQQRLDAIATDLRVSAATPSPLPNSTEPDAASSKKRARAEMVRVTNISADELLRFRSQVRRARLTYEALRGVFSRDHDSYDRVRDRGDLRAYSRMLSKDLCPHRDVRIVGAVPGVFVGDSFFYRAELCVVGLHNGPAGCVGFVPASLVDEGHPVATSLVTSGGYLGDEDSGEILLYTGGGGDRRGNLALHYSHLYGVEVRIVRGHDCADSPSRKVYVYDGLYTVAESTYGPASDDCRFKLVRLPGQDELGSRTWHYARDLRASLDTKVRPRGYLTLDLSRGREALPVPVCNRVDDDSSLLDVEYIARPRFPLTAARGGCSCRAACGPRCRCSTKNGGGPVYNDDGTLVRGRPVLYECGARCGCPPSCPNRATQRRARHRLEVFRSRETEWGVRTLDLIQPGALVCEYSGDVIAVDGDSGDALLEQEVGFVDPRRFPQRWREWGDASAAIPEEKPLPLFAGPSYVLDVSRRRNFAACISHSDAPNVFVQFVTRGNENEASPHMMVFAMDTIPPMRELSIDYGV